MPDSSACLHFARERCARQQLHMSARLLNHRCISFCSVCVFDHLTQRHAYAQERLARLRERVAHEDAHDTTLDHRLAPPAATPHPGTPTDTDTDATAAAAARLQREGLLANYLESLKALQGEVGDRGSLERVIPGAADILADPTKAASGGGSSSGKADGGDWKGSPHHHIAHVYVKSALFVHTSWEPRSCTSRTCVADQSEACSQL